MIPSRKVNKSTEYVIFVYVMLKGKQTNPTKLTKGLRIQVVRNATEIWRETSQTAGHSSHGR